MRGSGELSSSSGVSETSSCFDNASEELGVGSPVRG